MTRRLDRRFLGTVLLITSLGSLPVRSPSEAREIQVDGLPCNDLCQAWLGLDTKRGLTGPAAEESRPKIRPPIHRLRLVVPDPTPKVHHSRMDLAKAEPTASIDGLSAPKIPKAVVKAKHVRTETREAERNVPLPVPRPPVPNVLPEAAMDAPMSAISGSQDYVPKLGGAAAVRDVKVRSTTPDGQLSLSVPDRHAVSETPELRVTPSQAEHPPLVAPITSSLSQTPRMAANTSIDDASKVPVGTIDAKPNQPTLSSVADVGEPGVEAASKPGSEGPRPAHVVASLSTPVDVQSSIESPDHLDRKSKESSLQPLTELAGGPSPVTIGQISSELHHTDVHVVVVNVLPHAMRDIDVLCQVHDVQGIQVAESSAHIASIAPSDVAFERVIFHSEIQTRGNSFICRIGRIAAASDVMP